MSQKPKSGDRPLGTERAISPVTITTFSREKTPEGGRGVFADRPTSPIQIMTVSTSAAPAELAVSPESQEMPMGRTVFKVTPEKQTVPTPVRKYNSNANIITTEDNKIHIHLGSQFKRSQGTSSEGASSVITVRPVSVTAEKEVSTGTVLRSPRNHLSSRSGASKVMSTITITPVTTSSSRGTQSVSGQDGSSQRPTPTRIPMSKGMKAGKPIMAAPGAGNLTKLEPRAETQSMKIELKKSATRTAPSLGGGKG